MFNIQYILSQIKVNDMTTNYNYIHLPKPPTYQEKYSYVLNYPIILKVLYTLNIVGLFITVYNYFDIFNSNIIYYIIMAPIIIYLTCNSLLGVILNFFYQKFDKHKHENKVSNFWINNNVSYKINVFLPVCGEDIEILQNTWKGIIELQNTKYKLEVCVLDDKDQPEVKELAEQFGFQYIVRPNRGQMKKAGNLKYAFERTDGDFILILDADFRPRFDFIIDTLPYMTDPSIAIVQTPQFFDHNQSLHQKSPLQSGAGNIQEYFYKIIQVSRNKFGGAICVGSCALYRRKALAEVGGTAQVEHSEDVHTGFSLINKGWKIEYLPIILSKGVCPDDLHAFFKQQTRWCQGSMSMMTNPNFWRSKINWMTKLCYISGYMFYISNPLSILLTFQTFILLFFNILNLSSINYFLFLPLLFFSLLIQGIYVYPKARIGTLLAQSATVWFYSYTLLGLIFGNTESWQPTGIKSSLSRGFLIVARTSTIYLVVYLLILMVLTFLQKINFGDALLFPITFWIILNIFYHTYFWHTIQNYIKKNTTVKIRFFRTRKIISQFVVFGLIAGIGVIGFWKNTKFEPTVIASKYQNPQQSQFIPLNTNLLQSDSNNIKKNITVESNTNTYRILDIEVSVLR
jgi:cellulose synthase (UDP-forming)